MSRNPKQRVQALIHILGRLDVARVCGITTQAISPWIRDGAIPPARYLTLAELGRDRGVDMARHADLFVEQKSDATAPIAASASLA